jgi:hypothetical protein
MQYTCVSIFFDKYRNFKNIDIQFFASRKFLTRQLLKSFLAIIVLLFSLENMRMAAIANSSTVASVWAI